MLRKTKKQKIREHLESGKKITPKEAIICYNHYRLAAVIFDLKKEGMDIKTVNHTNRNNNGEFISYASYHLKAEVDDNEQIKMFTDDAKTFRDWLDSPPDFNKKKHIR